MERKTKRHGRAREGVIALFYKKKKSVKERQQTFNVSYERACVSGEKRREGERVNCVL